MQPLRWALITARFGHEATVVIDAPQGRRPCGYYKFNASCA